MFNDICANSGTDICGWAFPPFLSSPK